jgi:hypothetical protein
MKITEKGSGDACKPGTLRPTGGDAGSSVEEYKILKILTRDRGRQSTR